MVSKNNSGCLSAIVIGSVLFFVGWVCDYLGEQSAKMDPLANTLLGLILIGVFILGYNVSK